MRLLASATSLRRQRFLILPVSGCSRLAFQRCMFLCFFWIILYSEKKTRDKVFSGFSIFFVYFRIPSCPQLWWLCYRQSLRLQPLWWFQLTMLIFYGKVPQAARTVRNTSYLWKCSTWGKFHFNRSWNLTACKQDRVYRQVCTSVIISISAFWC